MLNIRPEQLEALGQAAAARWQATLVPDMRRIWPDRTERLDDAEMRKWIAEACRRAETYGLETAEQLTRFVHLTFAFGREFDRELPWAKRTLARVHWPPDLRMTMLWSFAKEIANGKPPS